MMNRIFTNPLFAAATCFAATFVGSRIHMLIYHNAFNLEETICEAVLFATIAFIGMAGRNARGARKAM